MDIINEAVYFSDHLYHWVRAIIVGNLIQFAFIAVLRAMRGRFPRIGPVLDRFGPKKLRSPDAHQRSGCLLVGIGWFALSWYVGHQAMRLRYWAVNWVMPR